MRHAFTAIVADAQGRQHRYVWGWQLGDECEVMDALCQQFRMVGADDPLWIAGMKLAAYLHELRQVTFFEE